MSEFRSVCARCRRPSSVCYCAYLCEITTQTRVLLLQHPRERQVAIGTARLASLCLPEAALHVGYDWSGDAEVQRALTDPSRPAALLYPGPGSVDIRQNPPAGPITLVVIDGTWSQTSSMLRQNPQLAKLPRLSFQPEAPSEYRIRREPRAHFVSTLEALVTVLGILEGDAERFQALMAPFRAMIDMQLECEARIHAPWRREKPRVRAQRSGGTENSPILAALSHHSGDLVCLTAEANAWPRHTEHPRPPELIYLIAERIGTGERLEAVLAARSPLNPMTALYSGLSAARLEAGMSLEHFRMQWQAFMRETDLTCEWGDFAFRLLELEGVGLPGPRIDLRRVIGDLERARPGTLGQALERLELVPVEVWGQGRAGQRLGQLSALATHLVQHFRMRS